MLEGVGDAAQLLARELERVLAKVRDRFVTAVTVTLLVESSRTGGAMRANLVSHRAGTPDREPPIGRRAAAVGQANRRSW